MSAVRARRDATRLGRARRRATAREDARDVRDGTADDATTTRRRRDGTRRDGTRRDGRERLTTATATRRTRTQIFESYEREFCEFSSSIHRGVDGVKTAADGTTRGRHAKAIEADVAECEALVRRMDLEARSVSDPAVKTPMLNKLRDYKSELAKLKRDAREASAKAAETDARDELLNTAERGNAAGASDGGMSGRGQAMETTERLARTGERIKDSRRSLLETEDLGVSILQDLQGQRETIERSREALHGADDTIGRSRKILSNMSRRAQANKFAFYGVSALLIIAILTVIVHRWSR
jgi:vesicle transport through interaction with t-SNAREs protein 1